MTLTADNVLDEKVLINYSEEVTIREYFARVMLELWGHEEEFSGYRPFGNSEWGYNEICGPLAEKHGLSWQEVESLVRAALVSAAGAKKEVASPESKPKSLLVEYADANELKSEEEAPEGASFTVESVTVIDSNRAFDRTRFVIQSDGNLFVNVFYSGLADSYWENEDSDEGFVTFLALSPLGNI